MNNKAQSSKSFVLLMLGVTVFVLVVALAFPINNVTQEARQTAALNCSDTSIDSFKKGACVISDAFPPYFIGILMAIGAAFIIGGIKSRWTKKQISF